MAATGEAEKGIWEATLSEWKLCLREIRESSFGAGLALAVFCVLVVIVGNVVLIIGANFWLSIFPKDGESGNSGQIAVQVIVSVFLVMCFSIVGVAYAVVFGTRPLWHALTDRNRMRGPLYRLLLLFGSGATNALTGVLSIYSMSHTPEFVQAVLLSVIPFCAQFWTLLFVPGERERRYRSLTLIASFLFLVAGVMLSSMSSFVGEAAARRAVPWDRTLLYFASAVVFGLWCVVQRLYLDAVTFRNREAVLVTPHAPTAKEAASDERLPFGDAGMHDTAEVSLERPPLAQRQWGTQSEDDLAAKTVLLLGGILFQTLVSFACLPVDAIPWFGTTSSVADSWRLFRESCVFIFASWYNVRYGVLHTFGLFMSFAGCAYLNERSPTLASVVLQLAGPVTGLVLIIAPEWDVYGEHGIVGHKLGGVILLAIGGLMYHVWDQATLREMVNKYSRQPLNEERKKDEVMGDGQ